MATYSSVCINAGDKEPVVVFALKNDNTPATGRTDIYIFINRSSDGCYFDWDDNTFKTGSAVITMNQNLVEVSTTFSPGEYQLNSIDHSRGFDTSKINNPVEDDTYFITSICTGSGLLGFPQKGELRVRRMRDVETIAREPVIF
jgi:hypothetical protein